MMTETTISKDQNLWTLFLTQKLDSKLDPFVPNSNIF